MGVLSRMLIDMHATSLGTWLTCCARQPFTVEWCFIKHFCIHAKIRMLGGEACAFSMHSHTAEMHHAMDTAGWGSTCCLVGTCWVRLLWPQQVHHVSLLYTADASFWSVSPEHDRWHTRINALSHRTHLGISTDKALIYKLAFWALPQWLLHRSHLLAKYEC